MNMTPDNKLLILDDHRLFIDGLQLVLQGMPEIAQVDTSTSAQALLDDANSLLQYQLILVDLHMPGIDGFAFLKAVSARELNIKVAVLSGVQALIDIEKAMHLGARGFIPKSSSALVLQAAVRTILQGQRYLPEDVAGRIDLNLSAEKKPLLSGHHTKIGERQLEVLELLKQGQTNKQIALTLDVTESAIKSHVSILFNALGVKTRTACVQSAVDSGLINR